MLFVINKTKSRWISHSNIKFNVIADVSSSSKNIVKLSDKQYALDFYKALYFIEVMTLIHTLFYREGMTLMTRKSTCLVSLFEVFRISIGGGSDKKKKFLW